MEIATAVEKIAIEAGFEILDTAALPGRTASYTAIPSVLDRRVIDTVKSRHPGGLYSHQSLALELNAGGADICLATSTASGKSLVFQTAALDLLLRDRFAKVIALYPAKALIQDQIEKWRTILDPFGMRFGFIDGTVPVDQRTAILSSSRVVLMTPDVMHSWLMGRVGERVIREFLRGLRLLILDEAGLFPRTFCTFPREFSSLRRQRARTVDADPEPGRADLCVPRAIPVLRAAGRRLYKPRAVRS
jgi:DEAD/DEAH box helicase domain-containing protein